MNPLLALALASILQTAGQIQTQAPIPSTSVAPVSVTLPAKYAAKPVAPDTVVASVDGQPIHEKDIEGMVWETMGAQAASEYVNLVIVRRAAIAEHVTVTQEEIEAKVASFLAASDEKSKGSPQRPAGSTIEAYLASQGLPISRVYLNSEIEITLGKIAGKRFKASDYVKLSVMEFRPADQSATAVTAASQKATAASAKLKLGQKWEDVLKSSDNPEELMKNGGEAGWIPLNVMPADLQKQLVGVKAGATTQPMEIAQIFQIFKVDELGTAATPQEVELMRSQYAARQSAPLMSELLKSAKVQRFPLLVPGASAQKAPAKG
jgi:hypothetical protein